MSTICRKHTRAPVASISRPPRLLKHAMIEENNRTEKLCHAPFPNYSKIHNKLMLMLALSLWRRNCWEFLLTMVPLANRHVFWTRGATCATLRRGLML